MARVRDPKTGRFAKVAPETLTASATVIPTKALDRMPRPGTDWQMRAWRLWYILGVLRAPTSFKAKQVGRLKWNVEVNGELLEPEQGDKMLDAVTGPASLRATSERLALNFEVAGEVYYVRKADEWNVYSSVTPKLNELLQGADIVIRGHYPDPVEPDKPTSSIQAALATAEQIRLMAAMSRGQDRNRLAQRGILLVPKEVQFPEGDDFQAKLEEAMTAPIADEYAPSAVVPLKVDAPGDTIEHWRHLVMESPYDERLMERIEGSVRQLALELDMPPEVLLGNLDSNHWNAWLSDENNYAAHVEPAGTEVGGIYAKALMATFSESVDIAVTPDPAEMLVRKPSLEDTFAALRLAVVGFDFVRRMMGADDDDAPTPEEIELILKLTGNAVAEPVEEAPVEVAPQMSEGTEAPPMPGNGIAAAVPTDDELDTLARQLLAIDMQLLGTLRGEARMAIEMARERNEGEVGVQDRIGQEMARLGRAWERDIGDAHAALNELGISTDTPEWAEAKQASVDKLVDGMTVFVVENIDKTDAEMPALPTLMLREVMATAGGSGIAVVAGVKGVNPTFQDPQGFAIGVLALKNLKGQGVELTQWRFRYGSAFRSQPFRPHKEQDGRFASVEGVVHGWFPGDHRQPGLPVLPGSGSEKSRDT